MQDSAIHALEAFAWIRAAFARVQREPARWLGMSLMYLLLALLLGFLVPVALLYNFLLALVTPVMLGGAVMAARSPSTRPAPIGWRGWWRTLTSEALRDLFQVFEREEHAFTIVIVCIVTLGLVVLVNIPELFIAGGSIISGLAGAGMAGNLRPLTLVSVAAVAALYLMLIMALFYVVPLTLFGNRQALLAVVESFEACWRQRAALALLVAPFLGVNLLIAFAFNSSHWLGYVLLVSLGIIALPVFVIALHNSYQSLFEARSAAVRSGTAG